MINYNGLTKAEVLSILYNNAKAKGMGIFLYEVGDMTVEQAEKILKQRTNFYYYKGRALMVDLTDNQFDETGYDKINGEGEAKKAIDEYNRSRKDEKVV